METRNDFESCLHFDAQNMQNALDVSVIEAHKENIEPLSGGRSALALALVLKKGSAFKLRDQLKKERIEFENELMQLEELDDPLDVYVRYISWCHAHYPQGDNAESKLLELLERCTTEFRDFNQYKNDSRYLKVWLEYAKYSDSPVDIFIYLSKKDIGKELALLYEEFAKVLELSQKYNDARDVYAIGIENNARPLLRLCRSLENFEKRIPATIDRSDREIRRVLTLKRGTAPSTSESSVPVVKKPKISVFTDDNEIRILDKLFQKSSSKDIGSVDLRKKENVFTAKPWSGEILEQQRPLLRDGSSTKIPVYRDVNVPAEDVTQHEIHFSGDEISTIVKKPGKKPERVNVNLDLLYPEEGEEMSLLELLIHSRRNQHIEEANDEDEKRHTGTFMIPLKDDDTTLFRNAPQSPTITLYSKMANSEVMNMFNSASRLPNETDNEDERSEANSTNYDGFVTETIHIPKQEDTPLKQEQKFISSPTIENAAHAPVDPLLESLRELLLSRINPPLEKYPGYHNTKTQFIEAIRKFRSITDNDTKIVTKGSSGSIVNFCGDEIYSLKCELGQGGFGYVYLIENEVGALKALKAETISSNWEFYILNQVHQRLEDLPLIVSRIVTPESLYMYKDESFLILNYLNQGTLLDVTNYYKAEGESMEEILCLFFAVEMLKVVEQLHRIGIIHGDLKADNCMISFKNTFRISEYYNSEESPANEWQNPKLILIDFGRAIDISLFPDGVEFINSFKADQQDCPQMNEKQTWSYEADYYGIAAILHTLLFGEYIRVQKLPNGKYKLQNTLKRYWQLHLWQPLFDILLNPYYNSDEKVPLIHELKYQRSKLELYLQQNSSKLGLKRVINNLERDVNKIVPKRR